MSRPWCGISVYSNEYTCTILSLRPLLFMKRYSVGELPAFQNLCQVFGTTLWFGGGCREIGPLEGVHLHREARHRGAGIRPIGFEPTTPVFERPKPARCFVRVFRLTRHGWHSELSSSRTCIRPQDIMNFSSRKLFMCVRHVTWCNLCGAASSVLTLSYSQRGRQIPKAKISTEQRAFM